MSKAPICPQCDVQMVERRNNLTGAKFYGCPNYPRCDETEVHEDDVADIIDLDDDIDEIDARREREERAYESHLQSMAENGF